MVNSIASLLLLFNVVFLISLSYDCLLNVNLLLSVLCDQCFLTVAFFCFLTLAFLILLSYYCFLTFALLPVLSYQYFFTTAVCLIVLSDYCFLLLLCYQCCFSIVFLVLLSYYCFLTSTFYKCFYYCFPTIAFLLFHTTYCTEPKLPKTALVHYECLLSSLIFTNASIMYTHFSNSMDLRQIIDISFLGVTLEPVVVL